GAGGGGARHPPGEVLAREPQLDPGGPLASLTVVDRREAGVLDVDQLPAKEQLGGDQLVAVAERSPWPARHRQHGALAIEERRDGAHGVELGPCRRGLRLGCRAEAVDPGAVDLARDRADRGPRPGELRGLGHWLELEREPAGEARAEAPTHAALARGRLRQCARL